MIVDENRSYYTDEKTLYKTSISEGQIRLNRHNPGTRESNLKHNINRRIFSNLFGLDLTVGRDTRWHLLRIPSFALCTGGELNSIL